jgi:hypothetical protein
MVVTDGNYNPESKQAILAIPLGKFANGILSVTSVYVLEMGSGAPVLAFNFDGNNISKIGRGGILPKGFSMAKLSWWG